MTPPQANRLRKSTSILISILISLPLTSLSAAEKKPPQATKTRPKIGLVLGGGGAKAGTQLGVLKVMEELRIPVDFVAGTSMGSFIGSLYAMGYPLKDIENILYNTNWAKVFTGQVDREHRPNRRKQDDYGFLIKKKIGFRDGEIQIGKGIVETQHLRTLLRELSLHLATIKNYDDFPIPYRAISIDLSNGQEVVLDHGEIPDTVRSSMSLPGIFPPVVIEGKHLVDGGGVNNLPISVVKKAGMDNFIAVDVGAAYYKPEEIKSPFQVFDQWTMFLTRGNVDQSYKLAGPKDVIIRPDLTGLSTESYEKMDEAAAKGEAAARAVIDKLRVYSVSEEEYAAFRRKRERADRKPPVIDSVRVGGGSTLLSDKVIKAAFPVKLGEPLDAKKMNHDVEALYAYDAFSSVEYDVNKVNEKNELLLRVVDNPDVKNYFRFGLRLYTDFRGDNTFGAGLSYTMSQLNQLGAEWRNEVEVGDTLRLRTEFYQPLEQRLRYFIAPEFRISRQPINIRVGDVITAQALESNLDVGLSIGRNLSNVAEVRAGFFERWTDADDRIAAAGITPDNFNVGRYFVRTRVDTVDSLSIPHSGVFGNATWEHSPAGIGSDFVFQKLSGKLVGFATAGKNTFSLSGEGGTRFGNNLPIQELYGLGGLFRLTGYDRDVLLGQHEVFGRGLFYHRIGAERLAIQSMPVYIGLTAETGNAWAQSENVTFDSLVVAGGGFVAADTMIGPIIFGGGYNSDEQSSVYLLVGKWFD